MKSIFSDAALASIRPGSIEGELASYLYNNGLFENQVAGVLAAMKSNPINEAMKGRWSESSKSYPPELMSILILSANVAAVEWIDANAPRHWARAMFMSDDAGPSAPKPF